MSPARDVYDPLSSVLVGQQIGENITAGQLSELQRRKAQQDMTDFFARREALKGAADEPVFGMKDIVRPDYLKRLYQTNPEAAFEIEQKLFGPEVAARKAGKCPRHSIHSKQKNLD